MTMKTMKPSICLASAVFTLVFPLASPTKIPANDRTSLGYLDVTSLGADPTGARDSTAAIQC